MAEPTRPIRDLDVPLPELEQQIREQAATPDPHVGLNPTGRPRRSSAPSRRKQARRTTTVEETS
ncbi:hypothetical protein [Streptomyces sp. NPDC020747]|uniref:hypothetical protein n=1 Tax=Streptomyces sp. NPDC020747 TaxID=3365086 RepID=UPI003793A04B